MGSTCTIVADLFRRDGFRPSPAIAGLMMAGLISDTLHPNSPTTTPKDADILAWLAPIAGEELRAEAIFASGSIILANPPDKVVRSDYKIYEESGMRFAVSQVEELSFNNFWQHAKAIGQALQDLRDCGESGVCRPAGHRHQRPDLPAPRPGRRRSDPADHLCPRGKDDLDLPGIVSRKKQLIPYLTSLKETTGQR